MFIYFVDINFIFVDKVFFDSNLILYQLYFNYFPRSSFLQIEKNKSLFEIIKKINNNKQYIKIITKVV